MKDYEASLGERRTMRFMKDLYIRWTSADGRRISSRFTTEHSFSQT